MHWVLNGANNTWHNRIICVLSYNGRIFFLFILYCFYPTFFFVFMSGLFHRLKLFIAMPWRLQPRHYLVMMHTSILAVKSRMCSGLDPYGRIFCPDCVFDWLIMCKCIGVTGSVYCSYVYCARVDVWILAFYCIAIGSLTALCAAWCGWPMNRHIFFMVITESVHWYGWRLCMEQGLHPWSWFVGMWVSALVDVYPWFGRRYVSFCVRWFYQWCGYDAYQCLLQRHMCHFVSLMWNQDRMVLVQ